MNAPLVSVVVPTLNAARLIGACLNSIVGQEYTPIELIVVDCHSSDETLRIAREHTSKIYMEGASPPPRGVFTAPAQRNAGARRAEGEYIYYVDADMILPPGLIRECVELLQECVADAVIVPERSFGVGYWAGIKAFERSFYSGDDLVEAPRFIRSDVWRKLGGLDTSVGGNDDWDFHIRLQADGYRVVRARQEVLHNEGRLSLRRLATKRYVYGRYSRAFLHKHGVGRAISHYNPLRRYVSNRSKLAAHPLDTAGLLLMRTVEYGAGAAGMLVGPPDLRKQAASFPEA
jgi:glycosyltransferase involved in cell wall biosynthesis